MNKSMIFDGIGENGSANWVGPYCGAYWKRNLEQIPLKAHQKYCCDRRNFPADYLVASARAVHSQMSGTAVPIVQLHVFHAHQKKKLSVQRMHPS